jgi:hypothetical protein
VVIIATTSVTLIIILVITDVFRWRSDFKNKMWNVLLVSIIHIRVVIIIINVSVTIMINITTTTTTTTTTSTMGALLGGCSSPFTDTPRSNIGRARERGGQRRKLHYTNEYFH